MATLRLPSHFSLVTRERIDSTNEEAKRLAAAGAATGTIVWAGEQTAGRGRRGRGWVSPPGNLYVSLLLRPDCELPAACQLNFVAAVALAEAIAGLLPGGVETALKWPNDVLVEDAKVSGILLEASAAADRMIEWLVIGVGVNVSSCPTDTPYAATSLQRAGATAVTAATVLQAFVDRFQSWYDAWRDRGFAPVRARWLALARGLGEAIEVRLDHETLRGRFAGLDASGALTLDTVDGPRRHITTGDLFFPHL
jgi:BirA family biotin operon repressor/biotin-[acetyl-CoA-carboxylase] ligase